MALIKKYCKYLTHTHKKRKNTIKYKREKDGRSYLLLKRHAGELISCQDLRKI